MQCPSLMSLAATHGFVFRETLGSLLPSEKGDHLLIISYQHWLSSIRGLAILLLYSSRNNASQLPSSSSCNSPGDPVHSQLILVVTPGASVPDRRSLPFGDGIGHRLRSCTCPKPP